MVLWKFCIHVKKIHTYSRLLRAFELPVQSFGPFSPTCFFELLFSCVVCLYQSVSKKLNPYYLGFSNYAPTALLTEKNEYSLGKYTTYL